jgi:hypothetical protein
MCLYAGGTATAQNSFDQRLKSKFTEEQIHQLKANSPQVLSYWEYYLDHAYTVSPAPAGKDISNLPVIEFTDTKTFNILSTDLQMLRSSKQYFRVANTGELFILLSNDSFTEKFNAQRQ